MWDSSKRSIYIEISSFCNFDCIFCGNHYRKNKGLMTINDFKLILKQIKEIGIRSIRLSPMTGELFVNEIWKQIFDIIEKDKDIDQFGFFTNLSKLQTNDILTLLTYKKLKDISISMYGHNFDVFKLLTRSVHSYYDCVINNLRLISRLHSLFNSKTKIYLKTIDDVNLSEIDYLNNLRVEKFVELDNFMGYSQQLDYPNLRSIDYNIDCNVLEEKNIVLWNGDFNLCGCRDIKLLSKLGNIKERTIKQMYDSESYNKMMLSKSFCKNCTGIR